MHDNTASFWNLPYPSQRMPLLADNVVATSQPLAAAAGLRMFARGGNAIDAALATAITLAVVEPCMNGIGADAFAQVWDGTRLHGLNASGRAPAGYTPQHFARYTSAPARGWDSVTVPGAVSAWRALWERFGSLPFADLFEPAIAYARVGYKFNRRWSAQLDAFNLFDRKVSDVDYYYASRLPGEPAQGVDDIHYHPAERRSFRLTLKAVF